jgi:AcrR family transcriptional regulator
MRTRQSEEKLLTAAIKVFSERGYTSSSVSDIIKEAGVARGTFYLYFESKHQAFEQVLAMVIAEMEKRPSRSTDENVFPSPRSIYERILSSYTSFVKVFHKNQDFARIVFTEALGIDKGFDEQLENHYNNHRANIRSFLEGVQASGFAADFNIEFMVEATIGYTERCARIFSAKQNGRTPESLAKELADLEFRAICNVPLGEVQS